MKSEEIRAVEMTRRIRDEMYEETKHLSQEELIRFFHEKAEEVRASRSPGGRHERDR